ncbi:MAG: hypothetical protein ACFCVD_02275 [Nodosilinea sp.]
MNEQAERDKRRMERQAMSSFSMVKVSFTVTQLPNPCSPSLLSNSENLAGKVLGLTRVPCVGEWIDFYDILYKVVKVKHMPVATLQDALVEVEYCQYENAEVSGQN